MLRRRRRRRSLSRYFFFLFPSLLGILPLASGVALSVFLRRPHSPSTIRLRVSNDASPALFKDNVSRRYKERARRGDTQLAMCTLRLRGAHGGREC